MHEEMEYLRAVEALMQARDSARPDLVEIAMEKEHLRAAERAWWQKINAE